MNFVNCFRIGPARECFLICECGPRVRKGYRPSVYRLLCSAISFIVYNKDKAIFKVFKNVLYIK